MLLVAVYLGVSIPVAASDSRSFHDRSLRIEALLTGVANQHRGQAGKVIVLKNAEAEMIRSAIVHEPFRIYGYKETYLVPEDEELFRTDPLYELVRDRFIDAQRLGSMLAENRAVVYDVSNEQVKDITARYSAHGSQGLH